MKVLVTGAKGQLGVDIVKALSADLFEVYAFGRDELDITDQALVNKVVEEVGPNVIVHPAAYTKVDLAETEVEQAYLVNGYGTRNLSVAAEKVGAKFCYISTDYVFNGQENSSYQEYDKAEPLGVYGKSKYVGEEMTRSFSSKFFIVRTAWVYGMNGHNFVKTMLRLAQEKEEIGVVNDQIGSPTYTVDLARLIVDIIQTEKYGIYHGTNGGSCSWYEFAKAIFEEANIDMKVNPITTADFPTPAQRPKYSVLGNMALKLNGFEPLRPWREALRSFLIEVEIDKKLH